MPGTIIHIGDVHLGTSSDYVQDILSQQISVLDLIFSEAEKNQASAIVIAGDLFNSPQVPNAVINRFFSMASGHKSIPVIIASGTHGHDSIENEKSVYRRPIFKSKPDNVTLLDDASGGHVIVNGIAFYSRNFKELASGADYHVLVFHGNRQEASNYIQSSAIRNYSYIAMGHFHFFNEFKIEGITAAYCGTPLAFEAPKGSQGKNDSTYALVHLERGGTTVEQRSASGINIIKAFIASEEHIERLKGLVNKDTHVILSGKVDLREKVENEIKPLAATFSFDGITLGGVPPMLIKLLDEIIAARMKDGDGNIPWEDVREVALKLISNEEGKGFLNPERFICETIII